MNTSQMYSTVYITMSAYIVSSYVAGSENANGAGQFDDADMEH